MKSTKMFGMLLSGMVLATVGATTVGAEPVVNSDGTNPEIAEVGKNNTTTTVTIIDNVDPTDPKDPLVPTDPEQKMLTLEKVLTSYAFESKLTNGQYTIASGDIQGDPITVFNDRIDRAWSVKAIVKDGVIQNSAAAAETFKVDNFTINGTDIVTGTDGIVAKAVEESARTGENNTGMLGTPVETISINFTDAKGILKANDKLEGTIQYTLYNTLTAE